VNNDENKYFDRRTKKEILIAGQIREKNKIISEQKRMKKSNNKVKKLVKIKTDNNGFANIIILGIISFILIVGILIYMFR